MQKSCPFFGGFYCHIHRFVARELLFQQKFHWQKWTCANRQVSDAVGVVVSDRKVHNLKRRPNLVVERSGTTHVRILHKYTCYTIKNILSNTNLKKIIIIIIILILILILIIIIITISLESSERSCAWWISLNWELKHGALQSLGAKVFRNNVVPQQLYTTLRPKETSPMPIWRCCQGACLPSMRCL